jgi:hypothetical protein
MPQIAFFHLPARTAALLAAALLATGSALAQTAASYIGSNGSYATPTNWNLGSVPLNAGGSLYSVSIGSDKSSVTFDVAAGSYALSSLSVGSGTTFILYAGHELSVPGSFRLTGGLLVSGPGAAFNASTTGGIDLSLASLNVDGGAQAVLGGSGPALDLSLDGASGASFRSDGAGSRLDLRGFRSLNRNGEGVYVGAGNSAVTDLPNLEKVAHHGTTYYGLYSATTGGTLAVPALTEVFGPNIFEATQGGHIDAASAAPRTLALTGPNFSQFNAHGAGSRLNFGSFAALDCAAAGAGFRAASGAVLDLSGLAATTARTEFGPGFTAETGGRIELASLAHVEGAHSFSAETGALLTTAAPAGAPLRSLTVAGAHSVFFRAVDIGSRLDFASIDTLRLQGHEAVFYAEVGGLGSFPDLAASEVTTGDAVSFNALTGGNLTLPRLAQLTGAHSFRAASGGAISTRAPGEPTAIRTLTIDKGTGSSTAFFTATGMDSLLDLTGFHSVVTLHGAGLWFGAEDTGRIDCSNLESITASPEWVSSFQASQAGRIDLSALSTIEGSHSFTASSGGLITTAAAEGTAPRTLAITGATSTTFCAEEAGSRLDFTSIESLDLQADEVSLFAERGGSVAFPELAISANSTGRLIAHYAYDGGSIELPALAAIDGAHSFTAERGGRISTGVPTLEAPRFLTFTGPEAWVPFRASGAGSAIDLSAINAVMAANDGCLFHASAEAQISLAGLQASGVVEEQVISLVAEGGSVELDALAQVIGAHYFTAVGAGRVSFTAPEAGRRELTLTNENSDEGFRDSFTADGAGSVMDMAGIESIVHSGLSAWYRASAGGLVDLSGLNRSTGLDTGLPVSLRADDGGTLVLGNLATSGLHRLRATGAGASIAARSLDLGPGTTLELGAGNTLRLSDSGRFPEEEETIRYRFAHSDEAANPTSAGSVEVLSSGTFEAGGLDAGAADPGNNGNFGFGRLVLGSAGAPVALQLLDAVNNGNRSEGKAEALYLFGVDGQPALSLRGGSELSLGRLNVYVRQSGGTWQSLQGLFAPGAVRVAYDEGYLWRQLPAGYAEWPALVALPSAQRGPEQDPNGDGTNNLLCYALGLEPLQLAKATDGSAPGLPRIRVAGVNLEITFSLRSDRPDVTLVVETSTNLVHWTPAAHTLLSAAGAVEIRRALVPLAGQPRLFARVRSTMISPSSSP